jgi:dolichol-phosphate mannosyltransferase
MNLTDAFCGFKAYRTTALERFKITDDGYAMPLQVWVQAVANGMKIVEVPVPLIYLDESRAFGGALDDGAYRLKHYREVFEHAVETAGLLTAEGCLG